MNKITEEEEQVYDRQIRLWGLDAQNRLKNAKVLIIGINGLSCEVIKNLVLTGINKIALCDDLNVNEEDINNNFLIERSSIGENRAYAAKSRVENLNPRVIVEVYNHMPFEICDNINNKLTIEEFDIVVCCTSYIPSFKDNLWLNLNEKCRKYNKSFFGMDSFGWNGIMFVDLAHHEYVREEIEMQKPGEKPANNPSKWISEVLEFCSFDKVLQIDWSLASHARKLKRIPKLQFIMLAMYNFVSETHNYATGTDISAIFDTWQAFAVKHGLDINLLDISDFEECIGVGNVPVNAVLGGLVTQEIIKAISKKNAPTGNFVLFNGVSCSAVSTSIKPE